ATASTSTPGPELLLRRLCPGTRGKAGLMGRMVTESGRAATGIPVRAEWFTRADAAGVVKHDEIAITNDAGLWALCQLPFPTSVTLRVGPRRDALPGGPVEIEEGRFPWRTLVSPGADLGPVATSDSAQRLPELSTTARI